ncbi:hypothetical protein LTR16_003487 [Cryomyces antarcticus]|uniref:Proteasome assembly chaperone 3 n=1 Tax=Cryomyces antarcticus TaxID=329879 RepID=A0ABR0LY08_9PEZI|nr:hypothetical protein LTR16_003487 [Cryomyces antarcticus]
MAAALTKGTSPAAGPIQLSIPLPRARGTRIHVHLTILVTSTLLFLTTSASELGSLASLGSFVYAMPNRTTPSQPLSTALYAQSSSLDFATRMAKTLARRTGRPSYVGSSVSFASAGLGGTVEEEMEGMGLVVRVVMGEIEKAKAGG